MPDAWSPEQYNKFKEQRSQPFHDLLKMVKPRPGMRVLDLGCGTGNLTKHLHEQLRASETIALEASENMLAQAKLNEGGGLRFVHGRIEDFIFEGKFDLIFSNAALQWVQGHAAVFSRLAEHLAPGGQLAIQMPYDGESIYQVISREVAAEFRDALVGFVRRLETHSPEEYARILFRLGFAEQEVVLRVYPHVLASLASVVEWYRGSLLTEYESRLDPESFARFVARYGEILQQRVEDTRPFFFPFPRILLWAKKS